MKGLVSYLFDETEIYKSALAAFFVSFVVGMFAHSVAINNLILNWDSLQLNNDSMFLVTQGKWLWPLASKLTGVYLIPSLQRPLAIFFISVCAYLFVFLFDIRTYLFAGVIGLLWVLFPSVSSLFLYPGADVFLLAMILSLASSILLLKYNKWVMSFILCLCSLGIYAAYIGMFMTVVIYYLMFMVLDGKEIKGIVIQGVKYLTFILLCCLAYYIILRLVIHLGQLKLSNYRSIDKINDFNITKYLTSAFFTYAYSLAFFGLDYSGGMNLTQIILNYCFGGIFLFLLIKSIRFRHLGKGQIVLLAIFILILPLSYNIIGVLGKNASTHWIMKYPFVAFYLLLPILLAYVSKNEIFSLKGPYVFLLLIGILSYHWFVVAQENYYNNRLMTDSINADCQLMVNRITDLDSFDFNIPVYVYGTPNVYSYFPLHDRQIDAHTGVVKKKELFFHSDTQVIPYINDFWGYRFKIPTQQQKMDIIQTNEFLEMPYFPLKGAIRLIDGVVVIKYGK
jgi:hypothetical protein